MVSVNKAILVGNLGRAPDIRTMQSGNRIANLNVATSDRWRDKDGVQQERTEWHRVVVFGKLAEIAEKYLRKGSKVYIEGRIQTRKVPDNNGVDRYFTEIAVSSYGGSMVMLDSPGGGASRASSRQSGGYDYSSASTDKSDGDSFDDGGGDDFDDDVPF